MKTAMFIVAMGASVLFAPSVFAHCPDGWNKYETVSTDEDPFILVEGNEAQRVQVCAFNGPAVVRRIENEEQVAVARLSAGDCSAVIPAHNLITPSEDDKIEGCFRVFP